MTPPNPDDRDKWSALYRLIDAHYEAASEKHERLRADLNRCMEGQARDRLHFDESLDKLEQHIETMLEKRLEKLVTKSEFAPVQKGFYGMCVLVFSAVITAVLKLTVKGA